MSSDIRESHIEEALVRAVKSHGGEVRKVSWVGRRHAPDRLVLLNGVHFVELKRPGMKPRRGQELELERLRAHGVSACWIDSFEKVEIFIENVLRGKA